MLWGWIKGGDTTIRTGCPKKNVNNFEKEWLGSKSDELTNYKLVDGKILISTFHLICKNQLKIQGLYQWQIQGI